MSHYLVPSVGLHSMIVNMQDQNPIFTVIMIDNDGNLSFQKQQKFNEN